MSGDGELQADENASSTIGGPLARFRMPERTFMVIAGVLVGVLGGYGAVGFRLLIHAIQDFAWQGSPYSLDLVRSHPWWYVLLIPTIGGAIVGPFVYFLAREAKGHGVPEVMAAVALNSGFIRARVVIVKSLASAMSIAVGGSVGREGPIVQIGAALGSLLGQGLQVSGRRLRTLVGCGAAAGIAATFNAPIAGAIFAVEIILGDFGVSQFSPIVIASVVATVIARVHLGDVAAFVVPVYSLEHPIELVFYLILGVAAALVALSFVKMLYGMEDLADRLPIPAWLLTPIGFAIVGAVGIVRPEIFGVGYEAIEAALHGHLGIGVLAGLLLIKMLMTSVTISAGGSGGVFAPSLFLGAMCGGAIGLLANYLLPGVVAPAGAYAVVGMGAVVAGTTHAPLTAILIIFELTHDYGLIVPLMGACIISTLVANFVSGRENIYTLKLLRRGVDLSAGRDVNVLRALHVSDVMSEDPMIISPGTPLGTIVNRVTEDAQGYLYVVRDDGVLHGVIGLSEMRNALLEADTLANLVVAADLAREDVPVVTLGADLDAVMRVFGGKNREELPVVEDRTTRKFRGAISRAHLLEAYNRELLKRDMVSELAGGLASTDHDAIFLGENHWMKEISAPGTFDGKTLLDLDIRGRMGVQVVLLRRPKKAREGDFVELVPGPTTRVTLGDQLVVVGPKAELEKLESM